MNATLDTPGATCYFESHGCSHLVTGHGGFDQHHPVPVELGGAADQPLLTVCPLHHRRQHALIRYLVECLTAAVAPTRSVTQHFTVAERAVASHAVNAWDAAGRPAIPGWNVPAARA